MSLLNVLLRARLICSRRGAVGSRLCWSQGDRGRVVVRLSVVIPLCPFPPSRLLENGRKKTRQRAGWRVGGLWTVVIGI